MRFGCYGVRSGHTESFIAGDITRTITDDDFIGLSGNNTADSLYLVSLFTASRNSDGSLPSNNLLRPIKV